MIAALPGALFLLMPRGFPARWAGAAWLFLFMVPASAPPAPGTWRLTVLDVGQGLAAVVRTREHVLLYDTGPRLGPYLTAARAAVLPYLRYAGIRRIDRLVESHGDSDHAGGIADVLAAVPVDGILAGEPDRVPRRDTRACRDGQRWRWDGVEFAVLHPSPSTGGRGNNRSCVLRVGSGGRALLIPGDIERDAEAALLARHAGRLAAPVLVAPHHGSTTSSTEAFVRAVDADLVIFAVGYRNRYGFPKQDIIARYHQHGATTLDTAASGAIDVQVGDRGVIVRAWRPETRRFWHSDP
jgi:competence protein ComEC